MMHPDDPFSMRAYRTSREAYGTSLYFPKRSKDWLWMVGAVAVVVVLAVVVAKMRGLI